MSCSRKTNRWPMCVFYGMINIATINSYVILCHNLRTSGKKVISRRDYMKALYTYSLHKYKNLLKPFLLVTPDGYIVDCFGPYKATTSDADIMKSLFSNSPLRQYFQNNDIFILDRGFRD